jgi:two-component system phosphate regulon response regulator PhoB
MKEILLVEDDRTLGEILSERLTKEGYKIVWARDVKSAHAALQKAFDLIILDINLPDGSGLNIAKEIKNRTDSPFLFMTALANAENRLAGFELGAEEFIPKPFHLKELLLRVKHVLDNHRPLRQLQIHEALVDFQSLTITKGQQVLRPAAKDLELLKHLIRRAPDVLTRDELLNLLWGEDQNSSHRTIDNMVVRLREILGTEQLIRAVRGVGYQWTGEKNV